LRRVIQQLGHKNTDLDRYIYLMNLLDHDETLFYRTLMSDPVRFLPIVYDPTIAEACLKFGHIFRGPRGMYLSIERRGQVKDILRNWSVKDVRVICVTDGGRILDLGDLGANGMGIPIGKLQLYTATAGVPPEGLLPIYLDVGTNNEEYLHDPLYLGLRKTRPSTEELYSFVDEFVDAAIGLANLLCSALVAEGMKLEDAQSRVSMYDINGLLEPTRTDLVDFQKPYAHPHPQVKDFVAAIESIKPTTIIGVSTVGGAFTQEVVEAMSKINDRPTILALSNPTERAECTPEQAYNWSKGKAIYAAGVQFPPVEYNGQTFLPGQANNFYIFPAIGLAIYAIQAKRVSDEMFIEAAVAVADCVSPEMLDRGSIYPPQSNILEIEIKTAARVAKLVFESGLARVEQPEDIEGFIRRQVYKPEYQTFA
jgi:malic enzyme